MKKYHGKYRPAIDFLVFISYIRMYNRFSFGEILLKIYLSKSVGISMNPCIFAFSLKP